MLKPVQFALASAIAVTLLPALPAQAGWSYDASAHTVSVDDWVFNATEENGSLVLVSRNTAGTATTLDFSVPLTPGAPAITRIASRFLVTSQYASLMPNVTDLILPNTVTNLGDHAFRNATKLARVHLPTSLEYLGVAAFMQCPSLISVDPFLPSSLTFIGCAAFREDRNLTGALVLSNPALAVGSYSDWHDAPFLYAGIASADLSGTRLSTLPMQMFRECSGLARIALPETFAHYSNALFFKCSALKEVQFASYPDNYATYPNVFFQSGADYRSRFLFPEGDMTWRNFINDPGTTFVAWEDATAAQRGYYESDFPDGPTPLGCVTYPDRDGSSQSPRVRWVVPYTPSSGDGSTLWVGGSPIACTNVAPAIGRHENVSGALECTAGRYTRMGETLYESIGYQWDSDEPVYGSRATVFPGSGDTHWLTWLWEVAGYQVATDANALLGSVSRSTPLYGDDFHAAGSTATFTAIPASGAAFLRWYGDVAESNRLSNPLSVTIDGAKSLTAVFTADWVYDSEAQTLSDGYWTLASSGERSALTVLGRVAGSDSSFYRIDLAKPIVGGGRIAAIGTGAFRRLATLEEVALPANLEEIGDFAFEECSSLASVTPFLPASLRRMGSGAFAQCPSLRQDLVLNCPALCELESGAGGMTRQMFYSSGIISADLSGSAVTNIGANAFRACANLRSVHLPPALRAIGGGAFMACPALETVTPFLPATLEILGDSAFTGDTRLGGDLILSNRRLVIDDSYLPRGSDYATFNNSAITSVDMSGTRLESVPMWLFKNCSNLRTAIFPKTFSTPSWNVFYGNTRLADMRFASWPGLESADGFFADTVGGFRGRIVYPRGEERWERFIATNGTFVATADVGAANLETYQSAFQDKWRPAGYATLTDGNVVKWLVPRLAQAPTRVEVR